MIIPVVQGRCNQITPIPPVIRQISDDLVLVSWLENSYNGVKIDGYQLRHWPASDPHRGHQIEIRDLEFTFEYVTVEKGAINSFQMVVRQKGEFLVSAFNFISVFHTFYSFHRLLGLG